MSNEGIDILNAVEMDLDQDKTTIEQPAETIAAPDGKMLSPIFRMLADGVAPNWKIENSECENVGLATEVYIQETWGGLDNIPAWVSLLLAVSIVVTPRLGIPLRAEAIKPGEKEQDKTPVVSE